MFTIWLTGYSSVQIKTNILVAELQSLLRPRRPEEVLRRFRHVIVDTEVVVVLAVVVVITLGPGSVITRSSGSGPLAWEQFHQTTFMTTLQNARPLYKYQRRTPFYIIV